MTPARWAVAGALVLAGAAWAASTAGPYLHAERMLDAAIVPPGSVQVFFLPRQRVRPALPGAGLHAPDRSDAVLDGSR